MFRCRSPETSHPCLLPQSPKDCSINLCLFFCSAYRVIINIFLDSICMTKFTTNKKKKKCVSSQCSLVEVQGENSCPCLFQLLEAAHIPGLLAPFHLQSHTMYVLPLLPLPHLPLCLFLHLSLIRTLVIIFGPYQQFTIITLS